MTTATKSAVACHGAMIAAPSSRQGKTVVTAALARHYRRLGKSVQVIKLGPDYLDPMVLEQASGQVVYNLDWWMMGEDHCRQILFAAAQDNDVVLVESLMGLHDNTPSNAWVARALALPVILVMNLAKYAQTAAAIVKGMADYDGGAPLFGVIGNMLGSQHHHTLVREAMTECGVNYLGSVRRDERMVLPERHLGLVQAGEVMDLEERLDQGAQCLLDYEVDLALPEIRVSDPNVKMECAPLLAGKTIAIARDVAFGFIYPKNLEVLEHLGAKYKFFSPLANEVVPACEAVWLPGGYPELYLAELDAAIETKSSIRVHCAEDKPVLAECGGMMFLGNKITDKDGAKGEMCGVFDADFVMQKRFQSVGLQELTFGEERIRGHSFHHSTIRTAIKPNGVCRRQGEGDGEDFYKVENLSMSYMHFYFNSSLSLAARFFQSRDT